MIRRPGRPSAHHLTITHSCASDAFLPWRSKDPSRRASPGLLVVFGRSGQVNRQTGTTLWGAAQVWPQRLLNTGISPRDIPTAPTVGRVGVEPLPLCPVYPAAGARHGAVDADPVPSHWCAATYRSGRFVCSWTQCEGRRVGCAVTSHSFFPRGVGLGVLRESVIRSSPEGSGQLRLWSPRSRRNGHCNPEGQIGMELDRGGGWAWVVRIVGCG